MERNKIDIQIGEDMIELEKSRTGKEIYKRMEAYSVRRKVSGDMAKKEEKGHDEER